MAEITLMIGGDASCTDGACGEVRRVVVDPVARKVTHLMVEPKGRQGLGRLVPLDLVDATTGQIRLRCTMAEFEKLGSGEETEFVPGTLGYKKEGPGTGGLRPRLHQRGRPGRGRQYSPRGSRRPKHRHLPRGRGGGA